MKPSIPPGARADRRMSRVNPGIEIPSVYAFSKNDFAIETLEEALSSLAREATSER